jgi:hypothetical protein
VVVVVRLGPDSFFSFTNKSHPGAGRVSEDSDESFSVPTSHCTVAGLPDEIDQELVGHPEADTWTRVGTLDGRWNEKVDPDQSQR